MNFEEFKSILLPEFPELEAEQWNQLEQLEALYGDWNARINVISRKDIGGLYSHHVLHSLAIASYLKRERPADYQAWEAGKGLHVLDLGTGGGFPGIPLAILFPGVQFVLCDSVGKKTIVAQGVSEAIGLKNTQVIHARAESLDTQFDWVVSRAVTALDNFYPWVRDRYTHSILYLKGGDLTAELQTLQSKFKMTGDRIRKWEIHNWLEDGYFDDKMVIDINSK